MYLASCRVIVKYSGSRGTLERGAFSTTEVSRDLLPTIVRPRHLHDDLYEILPKRGNILRYLCQELMVFAEIDQ